MINVLYWSNYSTLTQGGQKSLYYILRDIDRSKYSPVLACREEGELTGKARELGITVELLRLPCGMRLRYLFDIIVFLKLLLRVLDRHGVKIIHSEELTVAFMAFFLKPLRRVKVIWHVRVLWDLPFQKRVGLAVSDAVVCVSNAVKESFRSGSRKILVIHNGINSDEFRPSQDKISSDRFSDSDVLVGQAGTLIEHKKTHVLLRAVPEVLKKHPAVKFIIVGRGEPEYSRSLETLAGGLGISASVIFWGEEKNIAPLLNRIDIICLLSKNEGLSRMLLEAMCLEKPIVASDISQNRELIIQGVTGLTAKLDCPEDTASRIITLLDDRAYASSLGKAAREFAAKNFSLNKTTSLIENLYESLTAAR